MFKLNFSLNPMKAFKESGKKEPSSSRLPPKAKAYTTPVKIGSTIQNSKKNSSKLAVVGCKGKPLLASVNLNSEDSFMSHQTLDTSDDSCERPRDIQSQLISEYGSTFLQSL
jgi:hypothetical protein